MNTIATHNIDGAFVESHGYEVMDITNPTKGRVIVTCQDEEHTIRIANDTGYGLQRARRVASQIQAGRVATNGMLEDQQARSAGSNTPAWVANLGLRGIEASLESVAILE